MRTEQTFLDAVQRGVEISQDSLPAGATDCHFHLYDRRFAAAAGGLSAPDVSADDYRALQARLGLHRGVIVQPSLYGTDNRPTLEGLAALGAAFRAVVVVNDGVSDAELERLHALGVRGIRFNFAQAGATTLDMLAPLSARVADLGWHCQINMPGEDIVEASDLFRRLPCRLVFDHLAHCPQPGGERSETFRLVRRLLDQGNTWVKLSGPYIDTQVGPPSYADTGSVARALAAVAPNRVVWGTDWPHPTEPADKKPDDGGLLALLRTWLPDESALQRVLVDNPAELYDFQKAT